MSESRGAASVTLDTIIANALRKAMAIQEYYHGDYDVDAMAWVIRDALFADGTLVQGADAYHVRRGYAALCIDVELQS